MSVFKKIIYSYPTDAGQEFRIMGNVHIGPQINARKKNQEQTNLGVRQMMLALIFLMAPLENLA
ncbi:MAG: hypothetical protein ABSF20_07205 [Smithella sp.]